MTITTRPRRLRSANPWRHRVTGRGWVVFGSLGGLAIGAALLPFMGRPVVTLTGVEDRAVYGAGHVPTAIQVRFDRPVASVKVLVDGREVTTVVARLVATAQLSQLGDGDHVITAEVDRGALAGPVAISRSFSIDTTAPMIGVLDPTGPVPPVGPVTIRVSVDDPEATVTIDGQTVTVDGDGSYALNFDNPPERPIAVVSTDDIGNSASASVTMVLALPGSEGGPPIRGVHASGYTWSTPVLKDPIMQMITEGKINTVEIDLKDEAGEIWWNTQVALAHEVGAITELWDLEEVVKELHSHGVRVIGRLVVFADPQLADWAVETGKRDWIVQNPDGTPYGQYGGYTNPFNEEVWEYNIAIAEEAARLGVDDVLYDYVRRPDEFLDRMRFPGQGTLTPEDAIVGFLEASEPRIHAAGARLGASVFGIAATRPDEIAQDISRIAATVDYVAPMVYPSHWGPGEYEVSDPNSQPYDIVYRSLLDFEEQVAGTGATVIAWLQDFSLGVDYGPAEVRAQITAAADAGVVDFLLWDAAATYTSSALDSW